MLYLYYADQNTVFHPVLCEDLCISTTIKIDRGGFPIKNAEMAFYIERADQKLNSGEKPHSGLRSTKVGHAGPYGSGRVIFPLAASIKNKTASSSTATAARTRTSTSSSRTSSMTASPSSATRPCDTT